MKINILFFGLLLFSTNIIAQKKDTVQINADNLSIKNLNFGKSTYLMYARLDKAKPANNITLVTINTERKDNYVIVSQTWGTDTIVHTSLTIFASDKLITKEHLSWWKRKGYAAKFDYQKKEVSFEGEIKDETKEKIMESFNKSTESNFLNWHEDLLIFPVLPFRENIFFKIKFYEPGVDAIKDVIYEVLKSEKLIINGKNIDCWVLNYPSTKPEGYQRFWISKKSKQLVKEEDKFGEFYRYKFIQFLSEN